MKYKTLKTGLSQRVGETDAFVDREIGEIIEVTEESAKYLVEEGFITPVEVEPAKTSTVKDKKNA